VRREISRLADSTFDLLIIGAGIHGACAAWDASLRGLAVGIIDRDDFAAATSANSLRIVHGGLRYLARGDLPRSIESIQERSALLRIAPSLVEPLPVLVPTHGTGMRSRSAYRAALALNDLVSLTRNHGLEPDRLIPPGRIISRRECLDLFPGFETIPGLTGGALWYDARLRQPERLVVSFLRSAAGQGAIAANYVQADHLAVRAGAVEGASVIDRLSGRQFQIRARAVLVSAGPWTAGLIATATGSRISTPVRSHALGVNVVLKKRLADVAVGVQALSGPDQDPVCGGRRFLFMAPTGNSTALGTWYSASRGTDAASAIDSGVQSLLEEWNQACPGLPLGPDDVVGSQSGWLPLKGGHETGRLDALAERSRVVDHGRSDGICHLVSLEGVKYTTARRVAQRAVDRVFQALGRRDPGCRTSMTPLNTGPVGADQDILHAVNQEMAIKLADVVFRRTTLGDAPGPNRARVLAAARLMGGELGWDSQRQEAEVEEVMSRQVRPAAVLEAVE
jgi:glycerol-3-phosphate dehydrogenase